MSFTPKYIFLAGTWPACSRIHHESETRVSQFAYRAFPLAQALDNQPGSRGEAGRPRKLSTLPQGLRNIHTELRCVDTWLGDMLNLRAK